MHIDFTEKTFDDILKVLDTLIDECGKHDNEHRKEDRPEKKVTHERDAILDACRKYCSKHECDSCRAGKLIDEHHTKDDYCIICSIACCEQPVEKLITEVMRYAKDGDPKPKSYVEDYFSKCPDAEKSAIEKNGIKMPAVCRVTIYEGKDSCPGGKTCWECWQEIMEGN